MNSEVGTPTKTKWLLVGMVALAIPVAVVWWPGCRTYPPVSSRESLSLLRLLNTACNTKDSKLLAKTESQFAKLKNSLGEKEATAFEKILGLAKAGQWTEAEAAAFQMAQDQVGVGHPDPHDHDHSPAGKRTK